MNPSHRETGRNPLADLMVQVVWSVGAVAVYLAGATLGLLAAVAFLALTFGLCLLLARLSTGWRAVPAMFATLTLQSPLLCGLGLYALSLPVGYDPYPCFFWAGTSLQLVEALACVVALSSPVAFMLRLERGALRDLGKLARWAAPVMTAGAAVLVVLGAVRLERFPTADHYVDSLPIHTTIPRPQDQTCTPIEHKRDPKHDSGWDRKQCATPDFEASPLSFHYHLDARDRDWGTLQYRTKAGLERYVVGFYGSDAPALAVRRDEALDAWLITGRGREVRVVSMDQPRWRLYLHEIRSRVAPPLGWWLVATAGLFVALACFGASATLGTLTANASDARQEWLASRRGEMSIIALAVATCSSALLAAALFAGFLT